MKSLLGTGLVLATSLVFGAVSENFNGKTELPAGWSGAGVVKNDKLAVDGQVTCSNEGETAVTAKSSFTVKIPAEAVSMDDLNAVDGLSGCQTAVAAGEEAAGVPGVLKLMIYCGAPAGWTETGLTVAKDDDVVVGLDMDYVARMVQVKVGDAFATTGKATTKDGETAAGAWYPMATTSSISDSKSKVSSLLFVGSSTVDDVTIAEINAVPTEDLPAAAQGLTVSPVLLNKLGVAPADIATAKAPNVPSMTVLDKIECGLDPADATTFTAQALAPAADGKLAISVPYANDNGQRYVVVMTDENGTTTETTVTPQVAGNTATLTVTPGSGNVLKFQVKAVAPAAVK